MGSIHKRPLKLYIRIDGQGRFIAGSSVWRRKTPKNGKWTEITQAYLCCNVTTTTTTTFDWAEQTCYSVELSADEGTVWAIYPCGAGEWETYVQPRSHPEICLEYPPVLVNGNGIYIIGDNCAVTTTTTTAAPTTTTTTTTPLG